MRFELRVAVLLLMVLCLAKRPAEAIPSHALGCLERWGRVTSSPQSASMGGQKYTYHLRGQVHLLVHLVVDTVPLLCHVTAHNGIGRNAWCRMIKHDNNPGS